LKLIWLYVTEEEYAEIREGLACLISDRAGSKAERIYTEKVIHSLETMYTGAKAWEQKFGISIVSFKEKEEKK